MRNAAIEGREYGFLTRSFPTRCAPYLESGRANIYAAAGGVQDIQLGQPAGKILATCENMAQKAKAASPACFVVWSTITPFASLTPTQESVRLEVNRLLSDSRSFDAVVDLASLMPDPADEAHYVDKLHFAQGGARVAAEAFRSAIGLLT